MIMQVSIEELIKVIGQHLIIDVRTPSEYEQAHIPGAINIPLFTNEQRAVIGTAYKQQSKEIAIKIGLDYFGPYMRPMIEKLDAVMTERFGNAEKQPVYLHCWRGGMRSAAVAWLFNFYGYPVHVLNGGYKSYRQWVANQFEKDYKFTVVGGYTGSGKTEILKELAIQKQPIIDLEGLAKHKGSAFGNLNRETQPSQEMFENLLALELHIKQTNNESFWLEDESQRIGNINIPKIFWESMRSKAVYFLNIPFDARLTFIIKYYASFSKESIADAIERIKKRLGPLETKTAQAFLNDNNYKDCFKILLQYYDKLYKKGLMDRDEKNLQIINVEADTVDEIENAKKLMK